MTPSNEPRSVPVSEMIERYNRELMELYRANSQADNPTNTLPKAPVQEESWLERDFPLPNPERDRQRLAAEGGEADPSTEKPLPAFPYTDAQLRGAVPFPLAPPIFEKSTEGATENDAEKPPESAPFDGFLRVFVFTGQEAEPLAGAAVTVTRQEGEKEQLYATAITDRNGQTPFFPLPSVNPEETLHPGVAKPFVSYDVRVNADGFFTAIYRDIPVYGGSRVTQSAGLYPLIPGADATPLVFRSGGPADL